MKHTYKPDFAACFRKQHRHEDPKWRQEWGGEEEVDEHFRDKVTDVLCQFCSGKDLVEGPCVVPTEVQQ